MRASAVDMRILPIVGRALVGAGPSNLSTYTSDDGDRIYRSENPIGSGGQAGPAPTFQSLINFAGRRIGFWFDLRGEGAASVFIYQKGMSIISWPVRSFDLILTPTWASVYCEVIVQQPAANNGDNGIGVVRNTPIQEVSWVEMRRPRYMLLA